MTHFPTPFSSFAAIRFGQSARDLTRRGLALALTCLIASASYAQSVPPPPPPDTPPQSYNPIDPAKLQQLVAPVALYPDSLVAQVLAAATYPAQVAAADRFVQAHPGLAPGQMSQMVNGQSWDPSVKALTAFPSVLANMDRNLGWATQLGNAYYNQPQDVMGAVQADRQQAYSSGKLRSTPQLAVSYAPSDIVIAPASPAVVYVPYYDPWAVWGWHPYYAWVAPPPPPGVVLGVGIGLAFGAGIAMGAWGHWGWGWGHWGMGWGPHPFVAFNHVTYVSRSVTVINHGYYGRFNRGFAAGNRAGFHAGARAGFRAGQRAGFRAGERAGFHAGARAGFRHGEAAAHGRR